MQKCRFSLEASIRIFLLFGLTVLLLWLVATEQVGLYINPKFEFLVQLCALALMIMSGVQVLSRFNFVPSDTNEQYCQHKKLWAYGPFFLILLLVIVIPNNTLNANLVDAKGLNMDTASELSKITSATKKTDSSLSVEKIPEATPTSQLDPPTTTKNNNDSSAFVAGNKSAATSDIGNRQTSLSLSDQIKISGSADSNTPDNNGNNLKEQSSSPTSPSQAEKDAFAREEVKETGLVNISENNFVQTIRDIYDHSSDYLNREIVVTGFVYRDRKLADNQLVLVRYLIVCCAADASPYGLLVETKGAKQYPQGTWLSIHGVLKMTKALNKDLPTIIVNKVTKIDNPKNPYVYLQTAP